MVSTNETTTRPPKPAHRRRRIRALLKHLAAIAAELAILRAEDDDERQDQRRAEDTARKLLTGRAVLKRAIRRLGRIRWLRRQLNAGLTRAADRSLFRLEGAGPLIPEEDWPGWPDGRSETQSAASRSRTPAARRRARIAYLEEQEKAFRSEFQKLMKEDEPEREARNQQRQILVGVVILRLALRNPRVARWLRKLLDDEYTDTRDRQLFDLEGDGPIVREEDQAGLLPLRRQTAKKGNSDDGPAAAAAADAPGPPSTSQGRTRSGRPASSTSGGVVGTPDPELDDAGKSAVQEPIPGWRPRRIPVRSSTGSGVGPQHNEWGAKLEGRAPVAALPPELRGKTITVTDSNQRSWTTTITEVVNRDEHSILVRHTGRPRSEEKVDESVPNSTARSPIVERQPRKKQS